MRNYTAKSPVYGNIKVLHPEGFLMFCTNKKRADWYIKNNLARVVSNNPLVIQLTFVPNGPGKFGDPLGLIQRDNICVVCGSRDQNKMTRHHIVPYTYRRYLPNQIKERDDHDIVSICVRCHDIYEIAAQKLKHHLAIKYNAPLINSNLSLGDKELLGIKSLASALIKYRDKIPPKRRNQIHEKIARYLKTEEVSNEELVRLAKIKFCEQKKAHSSNKHGEKVVMSVSQNNDQLHQFFILWRNHFISTMKPKYMPYGWDRYRPPRTQLSVKK